MVWIVGPILAIILFVFLIVLICVLRKRRQNTKRPLEAGAVMTPLMSGETVDINFILIFVTLK
jgi:heme/copper-type cytochrome/quinol oxidase subunit 2